MKKEIPKNVSLSTECSMKCGRIVTKPEFVLQANILGGINILCKRCRREQQYKERKEKERKKKEDEKKKLEEAEKKQSA